MATASVLLPPSLRNSAPNPLAPPQSLAMMQGPPVMPPPPMPVVNPGPTQGFQAYASHPDNQQKVAPSMTPPNAPLHPNNPMVPPVQFAAVAPPPVPALAQRAPLSSPAAPAPLAPSVPTLEQDKEAHPEAYQNTFVQGQGLGHHILAAIAEGLTGASGYYAGRPGAGVDLANQIAAHDEAVAGNNQAMYRQRNVQPIQDALKQQQTQSEIGKNAADAAFANANAAAVPTKIDQNQQKIDDAAAKAEAAHQVQLARTGQVEVVGADGQKHLVDDPGSQVYKMRQALTDYHSAQTQLDAARTELAQAGNDPHSPAYQLALAKEQTARENAGAAQQRASAYMLNATAGNLGTTPDGKPVAGAMTTDDGRVVGSKFAGNVRPTGSQRNKANMADSADEQLNDITNIIKKNPTMFGPGYGQSTQFKTWLGSQDPDAQRFNTARTIAADHLAATFGGRSEAALDALDKAIGQYKDNPAAALAGIQQLQKANKVFQNAGRVRTVGGLGASAPIAPTGGAPAGMQAFTDGGQLYHIPANQVAEFKKDHPNAR